MIALQDENAADYIERVREFFSKTGKLAKARNFEYRMEQQQMAAAVAEALAGQRHLVAEAGTGVGKSLAYLIPSVMYALENKKKAIISTYTINLQEQLVQKDIPIVQKVFPEAFETVLWKGRQNYLCPMRLERARMQAGDLFTTTEQSELDRIWRWSQSSGDGTLAEIPFEPDSHVWSQVCSEQHICTVKTCGENSRCFYQQARKRLLRADVVVTNHTLFFLNLGSMRRSEDSTGGFLFENDFVVFDEAHTIEQVAGRLIGLGVSEYGLRHSLFRLYNPKTQKGLFQALRKPKAVAHVGALVEQTEKFFAALAERVDFAKTREYRVTRPDFVPDTLSVPLAELQETVVECMRDQEDEPLKAELQDLGRRIRDARTGIATFLKQESDEYVYWVEQTGKAKKFHSLSAAPVDIAAHLRTMLFRPKQSCIMTSATLSAGGPALEYFRSRVGAWDADAKQFGSPFDFQRQMKLYVAGKMPDPRDADYETALAVKIEHFVEMTKGRAFVLFTSYKTMQALASAMRERLDDLDYKLLVQGEGMPRGQLVSEFKTDKRHVLFGTESFWSGVDVPGEALSNVIITRLPFSVPDHPLIQARLEQIEARGGDPFGEYSLPEAILKLRQGVGRLIRTKTDSGIVAILDPRVLTKRYGKAFLKALPECPMEIV